MKMRQNLGFLVGICGFICMLLVESFRGATGFSMLGRPFRSTLLQSSTIVKDAANHLKLLDIDLDTNCIEDFVFDEDDEQLEEEPAPVCTKAPTRRLLEVPTVLRSGMVVEVLDQGRLAFGNFMQKKENSSALVVTLSSGKSVSVDLAQIISVWDNLADEAPSDPESWALLSTEAMKLLKTLPTFKLDLEIFWQTTHNLNPHLPVDSIDLGVYLFQEKVFKLWINPDMSDFQVYTLSAAQRYIAASLLHGDKVHFKRRPSLKSWPEDRYGVLADEDYIYVKNEDEVEYLIEGGYKLVPENVVVTSEVNTFLSYYQSKVNSTEDVEIDSHSITRHLRALELYSMQPSAVSPPPAVKLILKRIGKEVSPKGAREVLGEMNRGSATYVIKPTQSSEGADSRLNISPWPPSVLEAASKLKEEITRRRQAISANPARKKKPIEGRVDLRASTHLPLCIDAKGTAFFDDALSLNPETGEILVHIIDIASALKRYPELEQVAKERISSVFLPNGAIHMLPAQALDVLRFSDQQPNEAITIAFAIDYASGNVTGYRVFPSILPPVVPLDMDQANEIIDKAGTSNAKLIGVHKDVARDVEMMHDIITRVGRANPWLSANIKHNTSFVDRFNKRKGVVEYREMESTQAHNIINSCMSLYSNASYHFCLEKNVPIPLAWEDRDSVDKNLARRFATKPLRYWIAQQQQRQIRAALGLDKPLTGPECAQVVTHHNSKRKQSSVLLNQGKSQLAYDRFETYYMSMKKTLTSEEDMEFEAVGTGKGGLVRIPRFGIFAILSGEAVGYRETVKVRVKALDAKNQQVVLQYA